MTVSVKSLQKQLIAAIAMVLVAMIALGSSTYAWFASNTHVDATGMEVKASTSTSLAISDTVGGPYGTTMVLSKIAADTTLDPCTALKAAFASAATGDNIGTSATASGVTTVSFAKVTDVNKVTDPNSSAATVSIGEYLTNKSTHSDKFEVTTSDYITDDMYLKYTGEANTTVATQIVVTGTQTAIDPALHIALLIDGAWYNYDGCTSYNANAGGTGVGGYVIDATDISLTANTAKQITIYAWYEGEDTDCKTVNAIATNGLSITCNFDIKTT